MIKHQHRIAFTNIHSRQEWLHYNSLQRRVRFQFTPVLHGDVGESRRHAHECPLGRPAPYEPHQQPYGWDVQPPPPPEGLDAQRDWELVLIMLQTSIRTFV